MAKSTCDHCGSNLFFAENFSRVRDENDRLRKELLRVNSAHAITKAEHTIKAIEDEARFIWLQDKVRRQRIALERLQPKGTDGQL